MSMVALALRIAAVKALANATLAGTRVFDSAVLPIDQLSSATPLPFISISTEEETARPSGRDLNNGDRIIDLVIEIAIAQTIELPGEGGEGVAVALTDANLELSLAVLARQIGACLFGAGGGAWGDAFRAFVIAIDEYTGRRGVPTKEGQRFAARQMVYRIKAPAEPAFAEPEAGTPFARFLAAADADAELAAHAQIIRRAIEAKPIGWPDVYTADAVLASYTEEEARAIGIAPDAGWPSAPIEQIDVGGLPIDAATADAALPPEEDAG